MIHKWLIRHIDNFIKIVWVPSHAGFELNEHADFSMKLHFIRPAPPKAPSLSSTIKENKAHAVAAWCAKFEIFQRSKQLIIKKNKKVVLPSAWNSASNRFLCMMNDNPTLVSRLTRAITNHAPTGEYCSRFFPQQPQFCSCSFQLQT